MPMPNNKKAHQSGAASATHEAKLRAGLIEKAMQAQKNAYAPYSHFQVGAAIQLKNGQTFQGCNVENASYGATVCAERVAIQSAIAAGALKKAGDLIRIAVFTTSNPPWPPCGLCRQVIAEFSNPKAPCEILFFNDPKVEHVRTIRDLLPDAFLPDNLGEKKVGK